MNLFINSFSIRIHSKIFDFSAVVSSSSPLLFLTFQFWYGRLWYDRMKISFPWILSSLWLFTTNFHIWKRLPQSLNWFLPLCIRSKMGNPFPENFPFWKQIFQQSSYCFATGFHLCVLPKHNQYWLIGFGCEWLFCFIFDFKWILYFVSMLSTKRGCNCAIDGRRYTLSLAMIKLYF